MIFIRVILFPFSILYGLILAIRNKLFDKNILSVTKVGVKVVSVGNLSVGGTGKTPHVELLIEALSEKYKTAILSRGYGRNTKGYLNVKSTLKVEEVGDEVLNYAKKFEGKVTVAVCESRVEGANQLLKENPELELIILDDAYQHRAIHRDCNILLTEYNRPYFKDFVVPSGRLREFRSGKKRADIVLVTKSPKGLSQDAKMTFRKRLKVKDEVPVFFSSIEYGALIDLKTLNEIKEQPQVLLVTGIGNPLPLKEYLEEKAEVTHLEFSDHHDYTLKDIEKIHKIFDNFVSSDKIIVTTEKDAVRLMNSELLASIKEYPWCYQQMKVEVEEKEKLIKKIYNYVDKN